MQPKRLTERKLRRYTLSRAFRIRTRRRVQIAGLSAVSPLAVPTWYTFWVYRRKYLAICVPAVQAIFGERTCASTRQRCEAVLGSTASGFNAVIVRVLPPKIGFGYRMLCLKSKEVVERVLIKKHGAKIFFGISCFLLAISLAFSAYSYARYVSSDGGQTGAGTASVNCSVSINHGGGTPRL